MHHQFVFEWTDEALNQLETIKKKNSSVEKKYLIKLSKLLESIQTDPFNGVGKPEPLKYYYPSSWSRRITKKDRIIYRVEGKGVIIISILGHYE